MTFARRLSGAFGAALVTVSCCVGCSLGGSVGSGSPSADASSAASASGFRGDELGRPEVLNPTAGSVQFTVAATSGVRRTSLLDLQAMHRLMVVYFGYTHCPDECPATMADLADALTSLPAATRRQVQVVFVTSDPARDTASVLRSWLDHFDAGQLVPFVGLTGAVTQTDAVAATLGVPLKPPVVAADGTVDVEHGVQVLAFVSGQAKLAWLAGTTTADYAHDIPLLLHPA
ncbi:hypothetical protein BH10ACT8_BH10ACT8_17700 [soil metagenome]